MTKSLSSIAFDEQINFDTAAALLESFHPYLYSERAMRSIFEHLAKGAQTIERQRWDERAICKTYIEMSAFDVVDKFDLYERLEIDTDELSGIRHTCDKDHILATEYGDLIRDWLDNRSGFVGAGMTNCFVFAKFGKSF